MRVDFAIFKVRAFNCADNVRKLAHARRLYQNSVGVVFAVYFFKRLSEVANERTADTARIELVNLNACFL